VVQVTEYVLTALTLGLIAGFQPGPLSVVVMQEALAKGFMAGLRASFAPIITDGPIILAALLLLNRFKDVKIAIAGLGVIGGLYLLWMGVSGLRRSVPDWSQALTARGSLATGIKVNILNPHPYLFWFTVAGPYLVVGTLSQAVAFVVTFLSVLVSSKVLLAWLVARSRSFLNARAYSLLMRVLAFGLIVIAFFFMMTSYRLLHPST